MFPAVSFTFFQIAPVPTRTMTGKGHEMKHVATLLTAALLLTGCTDITTPVVPPVTPGPVDPVTPAQKFRLSVPATLSTVTGQPVALTPVVNLNGYTGAVTLTVAQIGSGALQITRSGNTFSIIASVPGQYGLRVTATGSDGQTQTADVVLNVAAVPQPPQDQVKPLYLPAPGAPVGSGDGTKEGTVYVSPSAQEAEVLVLVNEVRTKGTLNGTPATAGTCVGGNFSPRPALTYNGLFAYAARKHAEYSANVGYEAHSETQMTSPYFYGATVRERIVKTYLEQASLQKAYVGDHNAYYGGELATAARSTPSEAVQAWLHSSAHCTVLMEPNLKQMGTGMANGPLNVSKGLWGNAWMLVVSW